MAIKLFKFFRAGTHRAMSGAVQDFSEEDLQRAAMLYPSLPKKAPLVLGHPANDGPALGEVLSVQFHDGALFAEAEVSEQLTGLVRSGEYKNRSAAFWHKNDKANPIPGNWSLRHIGFLSKQRPALKDLGPLNFSELSLDVMFSAPEIALPMIQIPSAGSEINFSEFDGSGQMRFQQMRGQFHDAAKQITIQHPEFTYLQAARMIEKMITARNPSTQIYR